MPFIHMYAYSGRDVETQQKVAEAVVKAASEVMGAPETAFTVVYEEFGRETWEENVQKPILDPLSDKIIYKGGKIV